MTTASEILDVLSEDTMDRLRDGEEIEIATRLREPGPVDDVPTSFNSITITLSTKGTIKDVDDVTELPFEFPEVDGLMDLAKDWEDEDSTDE
jgi:hypothetical protein